MYSWIEAIYYTLIQLAKVNKFNALLLVSFVGYLGYQGIKVVREPLRNLFRLIRGLIDDRERFINRSAELAHILEDRH